MFECPSCKKKICSPTDLISVFQHYRNRKENKCDSGVTKPTFKKKIQGDPKTKGSSSEEDDDGGTTDDEF